jgi:hypothetical protein
MPSVTHTDVGHGRSRLSPALLEVSHCHFHGEHKFIIDRKVDVVGAGPELIAADNWPL